MTNTLTTLQSLRDRVANATGPDREIDSAIWEDLYHYEGPCHYWTASIDTALAWMGRVLPGWSWGCDPSGFVRLWKRDGSSWREGPGVLGPTLPLAIILATLDALIAKEKTDV